MATGEVLRSGKVFRLAKVQDSFPPNSDKPRVDHFSPSSREKALAPVLVSVFDLARTTPDQARALRTSSDPTLAFSLLVEGINSIRTQGSTRSLRVIRDPLPVALGSRPGADGHCGLQGLHRQGRSKKEKLIVKDLRARLCDLAELIRE